MGKILRDIRLGERAEKLVIDLFTINGFFCEKVLPQTIDYDLRLDLFGDEKFIEVKNDIMANRTGNIAIETFNTKQNKASGITATKADFWCYVLSDTSVYLAETDKLKKFINIAKPKRIVENAGDGNALIALYTKEQLFDTIFFRIDSLDKNKFVLLLDLIGKKDGL